MQKFLKEKLIKNRFFVTLCLVALTINYPKHNINSIAIILLAFTFLLSGGLLSTFKSYFKNKTALIFSLLFFIYAIGLINSTNLEEGLKLVKLKLPLLIFPLVFCNKSQLINNKQMYWVLGLFVIAVKILCLYMLALVFFDIGPKTLIHIQTGIKSYFHSNLTIKIDNHPTLFSFSIILCIIFIEKLYRNKILPSYIFILSHIFFTIFIFLLSSKIGVVLFLILTIYLACSYLSKKINIIFLSTSTLILVIMFLFPNKINQRFLSEWGILKNTYNLKDKRIPYYQKSQRLIAIDIFFNQPIKYFVVGHGSGDVQNYLDRKYRYYLETENRTAFTDLNYHNQYLQTASVIGVFGGLILIYILYSSMQIALYNKNKIHSLFIVCIICFFTIESFFETQRGTVIFGFFNSMFVFLWTRTDKRNN